MGVTNWMLDVEPAPGDKENASTVKVIVRFGHVLKWFADLNLDVFTKLMVVGGDQV